MCVFLSRIVELSIKRSVYVYVRLFISHRGVVNKAICVSICILQNRIPWVVASWSFSVYSHRGVVNKAIYIRSAHPSQSMWVTTCTVLNDV